MEKEINFKNLLFVLKSYVILLIVVTVFCGIVAFAFFSLTSVDTYTANGFFICSSREVGDASSENSAMTNSEVVASTSLAKTVVVLISKDVLLEDAAAILKSEGKTFTVTQLRNMISASHTAETFTIEVKATASNAKDAVAVVNAVGEASEKYIKNAIPGVTLIYNDARVPSVPNADYTVIKALVFAVAGFLIVTIIIIVKYFVDDRIKSQEDIFNRYNVAVLGIIPSRNPKK